MVMYWILDPDTKIYWYKSKNCTSISKRGIQELISHGITKFSLGDLTKLTDLDAFKAVDCIVNNNLNWFLKGCSSITNFEGIKHIDFSGATEMIETFCGCNIEGDADDGYLLDMKIIPQNIRILKRTFKNSRGDYGRLLSKWKFTPTHIINPFAAMKMKDYTFMHNWDFTDTVEISDLFACDGLCDVTAFFEIINTRGTNKKLVICDKCIHTIKPILSSGPIVGQTSGQTRDKHVHAANPMPYSYVRLPDSFHAKVNVIYLPRCVDMNIFEKLNSIVECDKIDINWNRALYIPDFWQKGYTSEGNQIKLVNALNPYDEMYKLMSRYYTIHYESQLETKRINGDSNEFIDYIRTLDIAGLRDCIDGDCYIADKYASKLNLSLFHSRNFARIVLFRMYMSDWCLYAYLILNDMFHEIYKRIKKSMKRTHQLDFVPDYRIIHDLRDRCISLGYDVTVIYKFILRIVAYNPDLDLYEWLTQYYDT
jgi:hypothetical protein